MSNSFENQYSLDFNGVNKKLEEIPQAVRKETIPKPIGDVSGDLKRVLQDKFPEELIHFSNEKKNTFKDADEKEKE